jgi:hypothetical protein
MLIDLENSTLVKIVKDGIKEMISHIAGRSKNNIKKAWFIAVKAVIEEYEKKILEEFLPVLIDDFGKEIVVRFSGGEMSEEGIGNLKLFMKMVERSNSKKLVEELVKKIEDVKVDEEELKRKMKDVATAVVDVHQWIIRRIDLYVKSVISEVVYKKTVKRSNIEVMLYSFVDGDVP